MPGIRPRISVVTMVRSTLSARADAAAASIIKQTKAKRFTTLSPTLRGHPRHFGSGKIHHRCRCEQRLGVVVLRTIEDVVARSLFNDAAALHHHHAVGDLLDSGEI